MDLSYIDMIVDNEERAIKIVDKLNGESKSLANFPDGILNYHNKLTFVKLNEYDSNFTFSTEDKFVYYDLQNRKVHFFINKY